MSFPSPSIQIALAEVRGRVARGELRLPPVPGGRPGDLMVPGPRRVFIVPAEGSTLAAISTEDRRRLGLFHGLACAGAVLVGTSWVLALILFAVGATVLPALVASGLAALLFAGSVVLMPVVTSEPEPVGPEHPLAADAHLALRQALADGTAELATGVKVPARPVATEPTIEPATAPGRAPATVAGRAPGGAPTKEPDRAPQPVRTRPAPRRPPAPLPAPTPLRARRHASVGRPVSSPAIAGRIRPAPSASAPFSPAPPPAAGSSLPAP